MGEIAGISGVGGFHQLEDVAAPLRHQVNVHQQRVALLQGQRFIHAAGNGASAMNALTRRKPDHLLAVLAQLHPLPGHIGIIRHHADHIAMGHFIVEIEQKIRRGQMEKMYCVRLQGLAVVHQAADFLGGRWDFLNPQQLIHCFGRRQMMADWANAAETLYDDR